MDFLKAVLLAILIHIIAPIVVHYVEKNLTISSAYEAQNGRGETSDVRRVNW